MQSITNVGSFEKCWKLKDGKWWMYKKANHEEMFSELFIYELGRSLGMNMAIYERGDGYIKSLDFTNSAAVNFEPASTFMGDNEDYIDVVKELEKLCPQAIPDYIRLIFMDTICANPDRHTNNFGLLRNINTGKFIGLAPNYDNNMALISRGYPNKISNKDLLIDLFNEFLTKYPQYYSIIPVLTREIISEIMTKLNMKVKTQLIVDWTLGRYKSITACINENKI